MFFQYVIVKMVYIVLKTIGYRAVSNFVIVLTSQLLACLFSELAVSSLPVTS